MFYISSRGKTEPVSSAEAIKSGLAPDGGLFTPGGDVKITDLETLVALDYQALAVKILSLFLTDFTPGELRRAVDSAYRPEKFDTPEVAPLHQVSSTLSFLELWHGPTCAFKDIALQLLPYLLIGSMEKTGESAGIIILVATSGDTGKAALEGFRDVAGTRIIVFYPQEGVSEIQKRQMITQEGENVSVIAVKGNFDDAQSGVKAIFTDSSIQEKIASRGYKFSSANSINWGRLVPQIVYYFHAYLTLLKGGAIRKGEPVNFVVPSGNFGNILAGFYARRMGLPIGRLICATNRNDVLTEFIRTGVYDRRRDFVRTISPSMDILISSNLERLLFEITGRDPEKVSHWMKELQFRGRYEVDPATAALIGETFFSDSAEDPETVTTIRRMYRDYNYPLDTHTAVGMAVYEKYRISTADTATTVIVSTASPFKFNASVAHALLDTEQIRGKTEFELLDLVAQKTGRPIPAGLHDLEKRPVLHHTVVNKDRMPEAVLNFNI
ncbi:MAG: threonine synthase [Dethiobacteria bacterium]